MRNKFGGGEYSGRSRKDYDFYEDTHSGFQSGGSQLFGEQIQSGLPGKSGFTAPRSYQNVVVYEPRTPADVQNLIDYLKRREPAIINLNNVDEEDAQRILDFFSGAIYALSGSIHRITANIFLLTPEGVVITAPFNK